MQESQFPGDNSYFYSDIALPQHAHVHMNIPPD